MVGAVPGITYPKETLKLGIGDTLVMYTDGVNEAMNEANEEYGDDRMMNFLGTQKGQGCRSIIDNQLANIKAFVGEAPQSDDITLMALTRKA
jgi:sigma-B regulation protein RsbU (phosphoserine phosphatase)